MPPILTSPRTLQPTLDAKIEAETGWTDTACTRSMQRAQGNANNPLRQRYDTF
jgi:hypothetical protein